MPPAWHRKMILKPTSHAIIISIMKQTSNSTQKSKTSNLCTKISITAIVIFLVAFIGIFIVSHVIRSCLIDRSVSETKSSIYLNATSSTQHFTPDELNSSVFQPNSQTPIPSTTASAIQSNHGKIVGLSTLYQLKLPVHTIDESVVTDFLTVDLDSLSDTDLPIIVPTDASRQSELDYLKELAPDATFSVVGTIPNLDGIYLVNDGSAKIPSFLAATIRAESFEDLGTLTVGCSTIAKFDNFTSAESYLKQVADTSATTTLFDSTPVASSPIGNTFPIAADFVTFYNLFYAIAFIILMIITFIILFCLLCAQRHHSAQTSNPKLPAKTSGSRTATQKSHAKPKPRNSR